MSKLSIIIPVYNMSEHLNQCLLTIRNSVRLPYEVIIVDDGSSDDERPAVAAAGDDVRILRSETHRGFSHAVNMGIRASVGEVLLFLHADVLLAPHTAEDMLDVLIESPARGAVTALTLNTDRSLRFYLQVTYHTMDEFTTVAEAIRARDIPPVPALIAEMYALMVRRDVVDAAGFLDEAYSVPAIAAYDYTLRMTRAGYGIALAPRIFVHRNEGRPNHPEYRNAYAQDHGLFYSQWGVSLTYSFASRSDLFPMMDLEREGLRVLEIGCACGATLRDIGARNPSAKLYGVELNENAAAIAAPFAQILSMNVEKLDPEEIPERFDYIIMGDVIEHLLEPWTAIRNMRELLVPGGSIIASIPNVANISNLYNVLRGRWTYEDSGLLDRTHFRFFTKYEIIRMFEDANLVIDGMQHNQLPLEGQWKNFREELLSLRSVQINMEDLDAFQWLVRARRV